MIYDQERLNVVLVGGHTFGCAVFDVLSFRAGVYVSKVFTSSDDRLMRHAQGCCISTEKVSAETLPPHADLLVSAHSHQYILARVCKQLTHGAIGYHPSLLPLHRGRDAVKWTIRDRDRIAGGSVYWMNDVADGGPIAAQDWCFVHPEDTAQTLWRNKLMPMGLRLIDQVISAVLSGREQRIPQDESLATWEPALTARKYAQAQS